MNLDDLLTPAGLASIVSLGIASLAFLSSLRSFRSLRQLRFRNLDERSKAVAFWKAWIEAQEKVAGEAELVEHRALAQRELNDLATFVTVEAATSRPSLIRSLLLLQRPRLRWTWGPQALFYLAAAGFAAYLVLAAGELAREPLTIQRLATFAGTSIALVVFAAVLRAITLFVDNLGRQRGAPP